MIKIYDYDLVTTNDQNDPVLSCYLRIDGIKGTKHPDGNIDIYEFLFKMQNKYSSLLILTDEWYGFMNCLTGGAGDENYEAVLKKVDELDCGQFASYVEVFDFHVINTWSSGRSDGLCDIKINLKRLAEDMFKKVFLDS